MPSNRSKGTYNKLKTRKWYEKDGYTVYDLETKKSAWIHGRVIHISQDTAGADLLAMGKEQIIFIQCKSNPVDVPKAIKEFMKHPYPAHIERHVVLWLPMAREPEVVSVNNS